jgi:large subunit ribosomal protein L3
VNLEESEGDKAMSVQGIIGKKVGMTQVYAENGRAYPVTVIEAGPCVIVQRKSKDKDGYSAVQLGLVEARKAKSVTKPMKGHFDKAGLPPCRVLREFRVEDGAEVKVGDKVSVELFAPGDTLTVSGISRGKGFQGVIKRHNFRGGAATHGSMFHRAPGSIGPSAFPSRVYPGTRSSGRMGGKQTTMKNLMVVRVDTENHLIYLRGAVPGARNTVVKIVKKLSRKAGGAAA